MTEIDILLDRDPFEKHNSSSILNSDGKTMIEIQQSIERYMTNKVTFTVCSYENEPTNLLPRTIFQNHFGHFGRKVIAEGNYKLTGVDNGRYEDSMAIIDELGHATMYIIRSRSRLQHMGCYPMFYETETRQDFGMIYFEGTISSEGMHELLN